MTAPIARHLRNFRRAALKTDLQTLAWFGYSLVLITILFALLTESVFYLSPALRFGVWKAGLFLLLIAATAGLVLALLIALNRIKRYRPTVLARKIGGLVFPKTDTVINALQLERTLGNSSAPALSRAFIDQIDSTLQALDPDAVFPRRQLQRWKLTTLLLQIGFILTLFLFWIPTTSAIYRWAHPHSEFPVPKPFHLLSNSQDISILGGENIEISIQSIGTSPDSVTLELVPTTVLAGDSNLTRTTPVLHRVAAQSPGVYVLNLTEVYQDYRYRAFVPARHFWQSWKEVSSATHRIAVTDRPAFVDFTITVIPPHYTGLKASSQKGNQASVQGLKGSTVSLNLTANRPLSGGFISLNDKPLPLTVRGRRAEGQFNLRADGIFSVHISDRRGIANREPIKYHLQMIPDLPPDLKVIQPAPVVELGEDQILPLHLSISDDFGFSKLQVGYEVRRPAFAAAEPYTAIFAISEIAPATPSQEVFSIWDLTDLDLFPEDEVHYHFELYDNDDVSGPKKSVSANFIARLPSLADLFDQLEQGEADLSQELELEVDDLEILNDKLEQAQLELLKREDINWEQQQALRESLEEVREKVEQMKNFSEALDQLAESAEKHGLFSEDMLEKFHQLQELIAELISPELLASMDRLSEALDQLDPQELLSAMEQLSANLNQMEQQLDRFLAIFERIRAEQKMEEVRERLEQLVEQQAGLDEKIQRAGPETEPSDLARMAQEEQRNSEEFDHIRGVMEQAADAVEKFSPPLATELDQLRQSELSENAAGALKNAGNSLRQQQPAAAGGQSRQALADLEQLQGQFGDLQQRFQQQEVRAMTDKFRAVLRDLLTVSKSQENLQSASSELSRNSPRLGEMANRQQLLQDQLRQIMGQLLDLSRETFAVSPEIGQAVGMAHAQMQEASGSLEQRDGSGAGNRQRAAMEALNRASLAVIQAMRDMEAGGSASGFEQFLQRMQQMSGQQQGINNQGLQLALGQMAASAQQALMKRMLQEQQQVRKSLQQLMDEMQQSGRQGLGDLGGIAGEMDEVLKDLQRQRYTRQTQQRQERILTRMLDSQRSLTQRDYKKERTSRAAEAAVFSGPGGLPADLGQRRSLALEALNRALKSGYPRDYQNMIRRYFDTLSQDKTLVTEEAK